MRKRELVQLHALAAETRTFLAELLEVERGPFDDYEPFGVAPTAIHRNEGDHREAVHLLLGGLGSVTGLSGGSGGVDRRPDGDGEVGEAPATT